MALIVTPLVQQPGAMSSYVHVHVRRNVVLARCARMGGKPRASLPPRARSQAGLKCPRRARNCYRYTCKMPCPRGPV